MPTYETLPRFERDWKSLEVDQQKRFRDKVKNEFVPDLESGNGFRRGLRVKGVQGAEGVFEMTWAPDGRATWQYGLEITKGQPHIIWRRIGTHGIFNPPPGP